MISIFVYIKYRVGLRNMEEEDVEIIGNTPLVFKYINVLPKLSKYRK